MLLQVNLFVGNQSNMAEVFNPADYVPADEPLKADIVITGGQAAQEAYNPADYVPVDETFNASDYEPVGEVSWYDKLAYGAEAGENILTNAAILMEAALPLGEFAQSPDVMDETLTEDSYANRGSIYLSPDEIYNTNFSEMSYEDRVTFLKNRRDAQIQQDYADVIASGEDESFTADVGKFGKVIVDPFNAFVGVRSLTQLAATAGLVGATHDALSQVVNDPTLETYDVGQTATTGAVSAVAAPVLSVAIKGAGRLISRANKSRVQKRTLRQIQDADDAIDQVNTVIAKGVTEGVKWHQMPAYVETATGKTQDELLDLLAVGSKKFQLPHMDKAKELIAPIEFAQEPIKAQLNSNRVWKLIGTLRGNLHAESPILAERLVDMDARAMVRYGNSQQILKPFADRFSQLPNAVQERIGLALANSDTRAANALFRRFDPELEKLWKPVADEIARYADDLPLVGIKINAIKDYVPRFLRDPSKVRAKLTGDQRSVFDQAIAERSKALKRALTPNEEVMIISEVLSGRKVRYSNGKVIISSAAPTKPGSSSSFQRRVINKLDSNLYKEYDNLLTSLDKYFRHTSSAIEEARFFGAAKSKASPLIDIDSSIQRLIQAERQAGKLNQTQQDRVRDLIKTRFEYMRKGVNPFLSGARDLNYMTTIGDPIATLTQLHDVIGLTSYHNGIINTVKTILSGGKIKVDQVGIEDVLATEMMTTRQFTSQALDLVLSMTGFKMVDRFGKSVLMTGALRNAEKLARSAKGIEKLRRKYGVSYGKDFDQFITDLQARTVSDLTKRYALMELMRRQPISASQMPEVALKNEAWRFATQLKSYALKQLDIIRDDVIAEIKAGNIKEGTKNLAAYGIIMMGSGATIQEVKDFFLGRGFNAEDIVNENLTDNFLKFMMTSEYTLRSIEQYGKTGEALLDMFGGGFNVLVDNLNAVGTDIATAFNEDKELTKENSKMLARAPVFGRFWYTFLGGGLEKWEEREWKKYLEE